MKIRQLKASASRASQMAFALVEVVVGAGLLGIMMVSLYGGMSSGFAVTQLARENLRGTQIMLERMEGVRLYNWDQLTTSNMIPAVFTNYYYPLANAGESRGIPYKGTMTITNATLNPSATYSTNMRIVTVSISWTSGKVLRTRSMSTYVSKSGIQNYVYDN
jgi:type II secretory pathway pseudopilin PulG